MQAIKWLNDGATDRSQLAKRSPTTRAAADASDNRADQARRLLADAEKLIVDKSRTYDALMLMKGITVRWPDLPQAKRATKTLLEYDAQADSRWREDDIAEQRRFLLARVRGLDSYASGPLAKQYEAQRVDMARAAINLWGQVILDGQDAKAVAEAKERLPELKKIVDGR
jgi:hypothetical protein